MMNSMKTAVLLGVLTALLVVAGGAVGGESGMVIAFVIALAMNFGSYWFSDKIVLKMYRAQPIPPEQAPDLHATVERLAHKARMPKPRVYLIPDDSPNAFATGRNPDHAVVAVTQGILRLLDRRELEGVLAHELAHVRNRDILIGSIAATLAGAVGMLASMARWGAIFGGFGGRDDRDGGVIGLLATALIAPFAAMLVQMAVSRSREFQADATGAELTGDPEGLASALGKLHARSARAPMRAATPATSHLFIVNPLTASSFAKLFSTHPPLEERIRRLRARS